MATKRQPRIKHRAKVLITDAKGRRYRSQWRTNDIHEDYDMLTRGVWISGIPVPKKVGAVETFTVTVEYLGEKQYKQTYQQRVKAMAASDKRREKWEKQQAQEEQERQEKELVQRRERIMNQVELAFVKQGREAVNFVTCDECSARATLLCLAYENPGSQVIDPEQITGARCEQHSKNPYNASMSKYAWYHKTMLPYKTKAVVACNQLEFFYDGLRQIVRKP